MNKYNEANVGDIAKQLDKRNKQKVKDCFEEGALLSALKYKRRWKELRGSENIKSFSAYCEFRWAMSNISVRRLLLIAAVGNTLTEAQKSQVPSFDRLICILPIMRDKKDNIVPADNIVEWFKFAADRAVSFKELREAVNYELIQSGQRTDFRGGGDSKQSHRCGRIQMTWETSAAIHARNNKAIEKLKEEIGGTKGDVMSFIFEAGLVALKLVPTVDKGNGKSKQNGTHVQA